MAAERPVITVQMANVLLGGKEHDLLRARLISIAFHDGDGLVKNELLRLYGAAIADPDFTATVRSDAYKFIALIVGAVDSIIVSTGVQYLSPRLAREQAARLIEQWKAEGSLIDELGADSSAVL
ncbi:hypothetical protein [Paraburkholderia caribensis]|uniref:hypothetical protein n=1 Tax=Paraburkholderia caribensis TaxID=75105 RepID=UPI001CAC7BDA|nr:hypothetical protein [Paraburkholderia caribensis]CAG9249966.1 hypothetical protein PCAR4_260090 [Paraburkholderia caribensis]